MVFLIVGAGLSGAVIAERIATQLNKKVIIIDKRDHIGGNCYDYMYKDTNIRINKYGAHIFHTNDPSVWKYVNRFGTWVRYEHSVVSHVNNMYVSIPVNITTVNRLCNQTIQSEAEMKEWLSQHQSSYDTITNSEEMAKSRIGSDLYDTLIHHYTYKQWNKYPSELDPSVLARIPIRTNFDTRYFSDRYQALPKDGYTAWFQQVLDHPNIEVKLQCDFFTFRTTHDMDLFEAVIYTGPIDHYFKDKGYDSLEYRSIEFHIQTLPNTPYFQPSSVVNYPGPEVPFTRIVEYKHFLHQASNDTVIVSETTNDTGEPYYPVPNQKNLDLYSKYKRFAEKEELTKQIYFVGRLANYKYFNMDQAIQHSLALFDTTLYPKYTNSSLFHEIIRSQVNHTNQWISTVQPPPGGCTIQIKQNKIIKIWKGTGWVHPTRLRQYTQLIWNVLESFGLPDCNLNINLGDHPVSGVFNFCRKKGDHSCFLLPNHRFTTDDIQIDSDAPSFANFDEQRNYIQSILKDPDTLIPKCYTSCIPHKSKLDYFTYAVQNTDVCDGYCYTDSGHGTLDLPLPLHELLRRKHMCGTDRVPWSKHTDYRFVMYQDGNTLSDRMRLLLCTNSVILRPVSKYEEFYTSTLQNGVHYMEYSKLSDIRHIVETTTHETRQKMAESNRKYVNTYLSYKQIMLYVHTLVTQLVSESEN